jgi:hypothetical protein
MKQRFCIQTLEELPEGRRDTGTVDKDERLEASSVFQSPFVAFNTKAR